ncbi:L-2-hydroxyglutarate oxidase [Isoptericola chiayiensis]|uniref:L-2-hydroxyglutarate oxidase n=1 Tax=Isoptericola chiayiensis TaxID=579446 RepID=A0ABP8Y5V5_9MICO|nr:L-2-hydroxyglutarate oxidase [Isoptericola chiayiensis]
MRRIAVVGAGIIGLAVAARLAARGDDVVVLEKEQGIARHQTGRNSGVIHSGLYYAPGSLKARLGTAGAASMTRFAQERGIDVRTTGKLVVATDASELPALAELERRGTANGVPLRRVAATELSRIEPHVRGVGALHVASTGIVDYPAVCRALADDVAQHGGEVRCGVRVVGARPSSGGGMAIDVESAGTGNNRAEEIVVDALVACAGLYADRFAETCGLAPDVRIVPFRGEYFDLVGDAAHVVTNPVYPVPDPRFPFLGVHLTPTLHGSVHAGPNAVLALAREGYRWRDVVPGDVFDSLSWPGLWALGAHHVVPGAREVVRSLSRRAFVRSLQRLAPMIERQHLVPAPSGVRAQALERDGRLVDDFRILTGPRQVHVLNAPSPAATASLEIARTVVQRLDEA